jgi:hypothetical protein
MMKTGYLIIFETDDGFRIPSGIVHHTRQDAISAEARKDQRGKSLDIVEIEWNDSTAVKPWR